MKGLIVSIVDVLGIFVPGFLLLVGIVFFPPLADDIFREWPTWSAILGVIRENLATFAMLIGISSYVLGFIIRLCSISVLQRITFHWWGKKLKDRATQLENALGYALKNPMLRDSLMAEAKLRSSFEVAGVAPYFPFAKRLIQHVNPLLYTATERLEAELRFMAGIFIPLLVFVVDGIWSRSYSGLMVAVVCGIGVALILNRFPSRRVREVIYDYHMALIVLHYPTTTTPLNET